MDIKERTFTLVKTTAILVPKRGAITHTKVTIETAAIAVIRMAHCGISSGETPLRVACQSSLLRYSANMRLTTALPP